MVVRETITVIRWIVAFPLAAAASFGALWIVGNVRTRMLYDPAHPVLTICGYLVPAAILRALPYVAFVGVSAGIVPHLKAFVALIAAVFIEWLGLRIVTLNPHEVLAFDLVSLAAAVFGCGIAVVLAFLRESRHRWKVTGPERQNIARRG
jgi:hypothetical protein